MKPRRISSSSAESAAAFRARFERRLGPPAAPAPAPDDQPGASTAPIEVADPASIAPPVPVDQIAVSDPAELVAAPEAQPDAAASSGPHLGAKLCARCGKRPAIPGRPGPYRCTECAHSPVGEICSCCGRQLARTPNPNLVDGQRVCRRCDPLKPAKRTRKPRSSARARSIAPKDLTRAVMAVDAMTDRDREALTERPRTRQACAGAERPCPWVGCRHHLYLDVSRETGSIKINFPDLEPWELKHTCALDVAERGGITLEQVGEIMNLTRERVRQVEFRGLLTLKMGSPSPDEFGADLLKAARAGEVQR